MSSEVRRPGSHVPAHPDGVALGGGQSAVH